MKIKDLKDGMQDVDLEVQIDFIGNSNQSKSYGDQPYAITFVKDDTGEIRMTFFGDDAAKVVEGAKVSVKKGFVTSYNDQLQLGYGENSEVIIEKLKKKKSNW